MSETPSIDPYFNPNVASRLPPPGGIADMDIPPPVEVAPMHDSPYWQELHRDRVELAVGKSMNITEGRLATAGQMTSEWGVVPGEDSNAYGIAYDSRLTISNARQFSELGILDQLVMADDGKSEVDSLVGRLGFEKFGGTIAMIWPDVETANKARDIIDEAEPASGALVAQELVERFSRGGNGDISDSTFRIGDNALENATMLSALDLIQGSGFMVVSTDETEMKKNLEKSIRDSLVYKDVEYNLDNPSKIDMIRWKMRGEPAITFALVAADSEGADVDFGLLDQEWKLAWAVDKEVAQEEEANQSPSNRGEAFIDTSTGLGLIESMERSALKFSPDFEKFLKGENAGIFDDRYGGPFTEISRSIARGMYGEGLGSMNQIFAPTESDLDFDFAMDAFLADDATKDEALKTIQGMMRQLKDNNGQSDVEPTKDDVRLRDGACFDVASYYGGAINYPGGLQVDEVGGKTFLAKTHGSRTHMNMEPVWYKGVQIPTGGLFKKGSDGGMAFLRLTPFALSSREAMVDAFGTEIIKAEENTGMSVFEAKRKLQERATPNLAAKV